MDHLHVGVVNRSEMLRPAPVLGEAIILVKLGRIADITVLRGNDRVLLEVALLMQTIYIMMPHSV